MPSVAGKQSPNPILIANVNKGTLIQPPPATIVRAMANRPGWVGGCAEEEGGQEGVRGGRGDET